MKALLYSFAACLYAMQFSFIGWAEFFLYDIPFEFIFIVLAAFFLLAAFVLACVNLAFAISQISSPKQGIIKTAMIAKLILIPFFVINFLIGFLILGAMANPFLFMAYWIVVPFLCITTYVEMFITSAYNLGVLIHRIRSKQNTLGQLALIIISQFIYFFDIVGSIILYVRQRGWEKDGTVK